MDNEIQKPLLLIDVDGVLNPFAAKPTQRPEGYSTHRLVATWRRPGEEPVYRWGHRRERGTLVWLNPAHGAMLQSLADRFDLCWCTAWRTLANTHIAPVLGLPTLPVIALPEGWQELTASIWKRPGVQAHAAGRALAWFDDEFGPDDFAWAAQRTDAGAATLLVPIDPSRGLTQDDADAVARWELETFH